MPLFGGTEAPSLDIVSAEAGPADPSVRTLPWPRVSSLDGTLSALRREPARELLNMEAGAPGLRLGRELGTDISYLWSAGEASRVLRTGLASVVLPIWIQPLVGREPQRRGPLLATVLTSNGRFDSGGCTEMLGWSAGALLASGEGVPRLVGAVSRNSSRSGASRLSPSDAVLPSGLALGAKMSALSSPAPADAIRALMLRSPLVHWRHRRHRRPGRRRKDRPKATEFAPVQRFCKSRSILRWRCPQSWPTLPGAGRAATGRGAAAVR